MFCYYGGKKKNRGCTVLWFWVTSFPGVNSLRDSSPVLVRSSLSRNTGVGWLMDFRKSPSSDSDDLQGRLVASLRVSYFSDRMKTSDDRKYVYIRRLERGARTRLAWQAFEREVGKDFGRASVQVGKSGVPSVHLARVNNSSPFHFECLPCRLWGQVQI